MKLRHIATAVAALAALPLTVAPSHADAEVWQVRRFESKDICVQRSAPTPKWRLGQAIKAWNATGLVNMHLRPPGLMCDPAQSHINVTAYHGSVDRAGYAEYIDWSIGQWAPDGLTWLYKNVNVNLNNAMMPRTRSGCWAWYISAHEIGHAIGLPHNVDTQSVMSYVYDRDNLCLRPLQPVDVNNLTNLGY